jgi:hypothetical protein
MKHRNPDSRRSSDRRQFDREWRAQGGTIEHVRGTGEKRYRHPTRTKPIRINGRRKDLTRKLSVALKGVGPRIKLTQPA